MRRLTRSLAAATLGAVVATSLTLTAPDSQAPVSAADERGRPTSAKIRLAASSEAPAFWNEKRMASATPIVHLRDRSTPRVTVSDEVGRNGQSIAGVDVPDERSGKVPKAAENQPSSTYPFPFGRHNLEKRLNRSKPYRTVGKVFFRRNGGLFVCSGASVVGGPRHVVFTAGHCLNDGQGSWSTDVVFIPARKPGKKARQRNPFGVFPARELWVPQGWRDEALDAFDMGAFSVGKNKQGKKLRKKVGALGFAYNKSRIQFWDVFGYPAQAPFKGNKMVVCSAQHAVDDTLDGNDSIGIGCDMNGGSSGGPWILRLRRGNLLNGIITYGYENQPAATYGPYFGAAANWIRCAAAKSDPNVQTC